MTIYGDVAGCAATDSCAWDTGCSIDATCSAVPSSDRRRLSSHANQTNYATVATDDVSQHVSGATFAADLKTNIEAQAASDGVTGVTIPALTVDHTTIAYTNEVEYLVTSTTATAVTTSALQGHVEYMVTSTT